MALKELLISPPGAGKTARCIEIFKAKLLESRAGLEARAFFVLPSREHAERIQNLILRKGVPGLFNAHILTIQDLIDRLPGLSSVVRPPDAVRRAAVVQALAAVDASGKSLYRYFAPSLELRGFQDLALEAVREAKAGLVSVAELRRRARPFLKDPVFGTKLRDFSILLERYDAELARLGFEEPDDALAGIERFKPGPGRPDLVLFDGFYHFTRAQRKLVRLLADWSERTIVTLTLDRAHPAGGNLFGYPERTRGFLRAAGFRETALPARNRRAAHPALRHLAGRLFAPRPSRRAGEAPVAVFAAPSRRVEYEMIAREVRRLYREGPCHFSDVCVILRSVSGQRALIASVFGEYGVPVTIHERSRLTESGMAAALYRFLRLVTEDWRRPDVLALAKSGRFGGLALAEALELERAALRANVAQGRAGWEELVRTGGLPPAAGAFLSDLLELERRLKTAGGPHAFGALLGPFLRVSGGPGGGPDALDAAASRSIASILTAGRRRYAEGREPFDAGRYAQEVFAAVEGGLVSLKPGGRNCVQVYDAVMALPKEYKVVFVSDLLERTFPQPVMEDPLFKDAERRVLNGKDPVFDERAWRLSGERYFFYMALTRARERVYLTHSTHDADGRPTQVSFFVDEVLALFTERSVLRRAKGLSDFLPGPDEWESGADVARGTADLHARGGTARAEAAALLRRWAAAPAVLTRALADPAPAGFRDPRVREALAAFAGPFSATGLEAFLTCPFRYFAGHLLRLNGPLEGLEKAQMGILLHETLRAYFEALPENDRVSGAFLKDPERMAGDLEAIFLDLFQKGPFGGEPLYRQAAWRESMRRDLRDYVRLEVDSAKGSAVPSYFEYAFGAGKTDFLRLPDGTGEILLKGSVDRIDVDPSDRSAVVIDYKRSSRALSKKLARGEEIQLPLYLLAARQLLGLEPAGMEHRVFRTGKREDAGLGPEALRDLLVETEARIRGAVRRIRSGETDVRSRDCAYCEFDAVCRIEAKVGHER